MMSHQAGRDEIEVNEGLCAGFILPLFFYLGAIF